MYFDRQKVIVDTNNVGKTYIIDIESGFKAEFNMVHDVIHCWPDAIEESDIEKAKEDRIDISRISYNYKNFTCKEVKDICEKIESFLKYIQYSSKKVKKVLFHFV